ncbi:MAG: CRISPR system precrRNA processing endoribonuclease RAMP protein Cas6 [Aggregatilineales bacterium]
MYDLMSIELSLRPRKFNRIPRWQGRAAQAMFYHTLRDIHPMVSETIHDLQKWHPRLPKPFTMSSLMGAPQVDEFITLTPEQYLTLRLTTLHPQLTSLVQHGVLPLWLRRNFTLHDQFFEFAKITEHSWMNYDDLLDTADDRYEVHLNFTSPTAFKRTTGGYQAAPDIERIFMSLYSRWNAFAPRPLPVALKTSIQERIHIVETHIEHHTLKFARGRKGVIPGFYGSVKFVLDEPSLMLRHMLNALAAFTHFSGVGVKTTIGMGQVCVA